VRDLFKLERELFQLVTPDEAVGKIKGWKLMEDRPYQLIHSFPARSSETQLLRGVRKELERIVGREIVDQCWPEVEQDLRVFYRGYHEFQRSTT
jgi:hypothetical protein